MKTFLNYLPIMAGVAAGVSAAFLFTFYLNRKKKKKLGQKNKYAVNPNPYNFHP